MWPESAWVGRESWAKFRNSSIKAAQDVVPPLCFTDWRCLCCLVVFTEPSHQSLQVIFYSLVCDSCLSIRVKAKASIYWQDLISFFGGVYSCQLWKLSLSGKKKKSNLFQLTIVIFSVKFNNFKKKSRNSSFFLPATAVYQ